MCPRDRLPQVLSLLPALQQPTVSSLADEAWVDVNTVLDESVVRHIIPRLKSAGARGIVEYPLNKVIDQALDGLASSRRIQIFLVRTAFPWAPMQRIAELKLELPPAPKAMGAYTVLIVTGNRLYVSGHGPLLADKTMTTGHVGVDIDLEGAVQAARQTGLAILSTIRSHFGTLDRVRRVVKTLGMVNCLPDFKDHPARDQRLQRVVSRYLGRRTGHRRRAAPSAWARSPAISRPRSK